MQQQNCYLEKTCVVNVFLLYFYLALAWVNKISSALLDRNLFD